MDNSHELWRIKRVVEIAIYIVFWAIIAVNLAVLVFGDPLGFQRLGSLWVALAIFLFGVFKFIFEAIVQAVHGKGLYAGMASEKLKNVTFSEDKGWGNFISPEGVEYERPLLTKSEISQKLEELKDTLFPIFIFNELTIVFIATLQWGYGDLFHCWINGNGWKTC